MRHLASGSWSALLVVIVAAWAVYPLLSGPSVLDAGVGSAALALVSTGVLLCGVIRWAEDGRRPSAPSQWCTGTVLTALVHVLLDGPGGFEPSWIVPLVMGTVGGPTSGVLVGLSGQLALATATGVPDASLPARCLAGAACGALGALARRPRTGSVVTRGTLLTLVAGAGGALVGVVLSATSGPLPRTTTVSPADLGHHLSTRLAAAPFGPLAVRCGVLAAAAVAMSVPLAALRDVLAPPEPPAGTTPARPLSRQAVTRRDLIDRRPSLWKSGDIR
ncbi:hypothetical protein [Acidipropionibacterium timonense]|uniref:hypothetical protein n=1 Tax=Acidipropionibacterium timonense TaxID=2161818 RepID=UPI001FDA64FB|nr:hypothetical protein [Acidipropionibacterium timonense]